MEPKSLKEKSIIFTIGHSNHAINDFLNLLRQHKIQVLIDIRSQPYSRYVPQFNRKELEAAIKRAGIKYLFLGRSWEEDPKEKSFMMLKDMFYTIV